MLKQAANTLKYVWHDPSNRGQRARCFFWAGLWQGWKSLTGLPLGLGLDNGARFGAAPKVISCSYPIYARTYESHNLGFVRQKLRGGLMLDIGANVGLFPLSLLGAVSRSIMFESMPDAARLIRINLALNGFGWPIHQMSLGEENQQVRFASHLPASQAARITSDFSGVPVSMQSLDGLLTAGVLEELEFVKIDVEGGELGVLRGAESIFKAPGLRLVQFERLSHTPLEPLLDFFGGKGWRVFALDETGEPDYSPSSVARSKDLFAEKDHGEPSP